MAFEIKTRFVVIYTHHEQKASNLLIPKKFTSRSMRLGYQLKSKPYPKVRSKINIQIEE